MATPINPVNPLPIQPAAGQPENAVTAKPILSYQQLGKYRIIRQIGKGGMATVYEAVGSDEADPQTSVAIKVMSLDMAESQSDVKRFEREIKIISEIQHPHIVKMIDYGQQDGVLYLVMELLSGGTLARVVRTSNVMLPLSTVATLLEQIADALSYAHERGIIHRDLKPDNVLLDQAQNAYLSDFGIATLIRRNTTQVATGAGITLGTPAYMAPEHWQNEPVDERTDIYALGIMLFEMLTGKQPFTSDTPLGIMNKHLFEPPPSITALRPDIPAGVALVVDRALAKLPEQRFASVSDMAYTFKSYMNSKRSALSARPKIHLTLAAVPSHEKPALGEGEITRSLAPLDHSTRVLNVSDHSDVQVAQVSSTTHPQSLVNVKSSFWNKLLNWLKIRR